MKTLNLNLFLSLLLVAAGCGDGGGGSAGTGGNAGTGGSAGTGGNAGTGGAAGTGGVGGTGGEAGTGGTGGSMGPPQLLSEWGLFKSIPDQIPENGVVPFDVTSPLFTDYASKLRFVQLPDGEKIEYTNTGRWANQAGTIYVKTFAYPVDARMPELGTQLIETRILQFVEDDVVDMWVYVYPDGSNDDADLTLGGETLDVSYINLAGDTVDLDYAVPSVPACRNCHSPAPRSRSLGPSSGMLNRDQDYGGDVGVMNQIDYMDSLGMFTSTPPPVDQRTTYVTAPSINTAAELHERARSYLDSNCAHCHAPDGEVSDKGLYLDYQSMDPVNGTPFTWGVCKVPTSAGNGTTCDQSLYIVPGDPAASLFLCRMESVTPGELMPPLGRTVVDTEGVALIREWIEQLPILFPDLPDCP